MPNRYTEAQRKTAVAAAKARGAEETIASVARAHSIPVSTLRGWLRQSAERRGILGWRPSTHQVLLIVMVTTTVATVLLLFNLSYDKEPDDLPPLDAQMMPYDIYLAPTSTDLAKDFGGVRLNSDPHITVDANLKGSVIVSLAVAFAVRDPSTAPTVTFRVPDTDHILEASSCSTIITDIDLLPSWLDPVHAGFRHVLVPITEAGNCAVRLTLLGASEHFIAEHRTGVRRFGISSGQEFGRLPMGIGYKADSGSYPWLLSLGAVGDERSWRLTFYIPHDQVFERLEPAVEKSSGSDAHWRGPLISAWGTFLDPAQRRQVTLTKKIVNGVGASGILVTILGAMITSILFGPDRRK